MTITGQALDPGPLGRRTDREAAGPARAGEGAAQPPKLSRLRRLFLLDLLGVY